MTFLIPNPTLALILSFVSVVDILFHTTFFPDFPPSPFFIKFREHIYPYPIHKSRLIISLELLLTLCSP